MRTLLHELENLRHATTGNVEDADSKAPDHAMDAGRYLLNLGGGPQLAIDDVPPASLLEANGIGSARDGDGRWRYP